MKNIIQKKVPYAVANFERIIEEDFYFVDKTSYITELEQYDAPVFLRPRRFGKTLLCSILECYYDINRADKFDALFKDTYIGKNPTPEKNSCMVMRFNFSKIPLGDNLKELKFNFNYECALSIDLFKSQYQQYLGTLSNLPQDVTLQLSDILTAINKKQLPPLYIIIDEYDNFTNQLIQAQKDTLYSEITTGDSFLRTFFKVIKAGLENNSVRRCYITGVLPITIDDLTSGFNVAEIITLEDEFVNMLGFTQKEVEIYLNQIFNDYNFDKSKLSYVKEVLKKHYNGYRFGLDCEPIYNSTIASFFLKDFTLNGGKIPRELIDDNVKTDVNWIRRLTGSDKNTKEMLEEIILTGELPYDQEMISSKFNMRSFFKKDFYPVSLFYLGMLTFKDRYAMTFPNQTMKKIFASYFNEIEDIDVSHDYTGYFRQFLKDQDLKKLFAGYFKTYMGRIPAQCFDKANENLYRITFYEICSRYLSHDFTFALETNYPSGRSDWEMTGRYNTEFENLKWLVEFKHYSRKKAKEAKIAHLTKPFKKDADQIENYKQDILKEFPHFKIRTFIIYTIGSDSFNFLETTK